MQAKAVVFPSPNTVEVSPVECPEPEAGDVVVRVTHSWISNGTEGSFLRGERIAGDTAYREGDPFPFPIVAGYQKIGVVEWVGDAVNDIEVGETVFAAMGKVLNMYAPFAGQISPSVSPRSHVWKLPKDVDPIAFSGLVLTQVGFNCGVKAPVCVGDGAIVIGDGMVGQWAAQTLAWRGANTVLVGRHDYRLDLFSTSPLRHTVNAHQTDWVEEARGLLPNGARVAVDTVGSLTALELVRPLLNQFGHIVSAGFMGTDDLISMQAMREGELSLDFVSGWTKQRMDNTRDLIAAGFLQTLPLITHRFPVDQASEAWDLIETKREPVLGVILEWD